MTSDHVTECLGGPDELLDNHLANNYTTYCDPRLNCKQSIEVFTNFFLIFNIIDGISVGRIVIKR